MNYVPFRNCHPRAGARARRDMGPLVAPTRTSRFRLRPKFPAGRSAAGEGRSTYWSGSLRRHTRGSPKAPDSAFEAPVDFAAVPRPSCASRSARGHRAAVRACRGQSDALCLDAAPLFSTSCLQMARPKPSTNPVLAVAGHAGVRTEQVRQPFRRLAQLVVGIRLLASTVVPAIPSTRLSSTTVSGSATWAVLQRCWRDTPSGWVPTS